MSKITLVAKLTAADGKADEVEAAIKEVVAAADEEPGLEVYAASRVSDQPDVFWFFEVYSDGDAFAVHGKGDRMRAANRAFGGLLAGPPEITLMSPVGAKGLDL